MAKNDKGVATQNDNDLLEHTMGGVTTRSDATDVGVPMLPGSGNEPQGPEDALGLGPKRGDYTDRLGGTGYRPHTSEAIPDAKPGEATVRIVPQAPRTQDIGDEAGAKGGVTTKAQTEQNRTDAAGTVLSDTQERA